MSNVIHFLDRKPVHYSIHISHFGESFQIQVEGVADDERSRLAVAHDLELAAKTIRKPTDSTEEA